MYVVSFEYMRFCLSKDEGSQNNVKYIVSEEIETFDVRKRKYNVRSSRMDVKRELTNDDVWNSNLGYEDE